MDNTGILYTVITQYTHELTVKINLFYTVGPVCKFLRNRGGRLQILKKNWGGEPGHYGRYAYEYTQYYHYG